MQKTKYQNIPCAQPGCKKFSMLDGSGFCERHNPEKAKSRKEAALKAAAARKISLTFDKKCGIEACKSWRRKGSIYCSFHYRVYDPNSGQISCLKENCRNHVLDKSGYCFAHSPLLTESFKRVCSTLNEKREDALLKAKCCMEGCNSFRMTDDSGYCFWHNPALEEAQRQTLKKSFKTKRLNKAPPEKACKVRSCKRWALEDGSGWCFFHQPAFRQERRKRMLGNKLAKGHHTPWLGLKDINEARGLIFYSLIFDRPLLTLRALTKIASLHARGEVYIPAIHNPLYKDVQSLERNLELSLPDGNNNTVIPKRPVL